MHKKIIAITFLILFICTFIKFFVSDYDVKYKRNSFEIHEVYKNKRMFFNIKKDNNTYSFDILGKRRMGKGIIKEIKTIEVKDNYICVIPFIKGKQTYPICKKDNEDISYYLINDPLLNADVDKLKIRTGKYNINKENEFQYNNNLNKNEFIAYWNYRGFNILNYKNDIIKTNVFVNDIYNTRLNYQINNYILMPDYNEKHVFKNMIVFDIVSSKYYKIQGKYEIDYDSKVVGQHKNSVYIFDNKYLKLYEVNIKRKKIIEVGSEEKGYIKILNGKEVKATRREYVTDKITYFDEKDSYYEYYVKNNKLYKVYKDNKNSVVIYNGDATILSQYNDSLYFRVDDVLYKYTPVKGVECVMYNFEFNFNVNNLFVYNK